MTTLRRLTFDVTGEEIIQALQDLNVGDEIVFGCEVRRFLSFDEALRDEIVSRVQTLYRAERVMLFQRRDAGTKLWFKVARVVESGTTQRITSAVSRYEILKGLKKATQPKRVH